jgi:hypothetical protein
VSHADPLLYTVIEVDIVAASLEVEIERIFAVDVGVEDIVHVGDVLEWCSVDSPRNVSITQAQLV